MGKESHGGVVLAGADGGIGSTLVDSLMPRAFRAFAAVRSREACDVGKRARLSGISSEHTLAEPSSCLCLR
jgi:hypothetical protein